MAEAAHLARRGRPRLRDPGVASGPAPSAGGPSASEDLDVVLVHTPGREDRLGETPYTEVGPLADRIAAEIRAHADRPFAVFGHSAGALVGREVPGASPRACSRSPRRCPRPAGRGPGGHRRGTAGRAGRVGRHAPRDPRRPRRAGGVPAPPARRPEPRRIVPPGRRRAAGRADHRVRGTGDASASLDDCAAWSAWTARKFEAHALPGGHFFPVEQGAAILRRIAERF